MSISREVFTARYIWYWTDWEIERLFTFLELHHLTITEEESPE